jgi:tetratricopeptide (TPR) repeat protein
MTKGDNSPNVQRALKLEGWISFALLGMFWVVVGSVAYHVFPVVICLNELNASNQEICRTALSRASIPSVFRSKVRVKLLGMLGPDSSEEILTLVNDAEKDNDLSGGLRLSRANAFRNLDRPDEAVTEFLAVLKLEPSNEDAINALIRLRIDKKQFDEARNEAQNYLSANPGSWNTIAWLGWVEHLTGNQDLAVDLYGRAIKLSPEVYWLYQDLGDIHEAAGQFDKAVENFTIIIEKDSTDTSALLRRADAYEGMDDYKHAQADYEKALENARDYNTLVLLGRSYTDSEDFAKAALLFEEAFKSEDLDDWGYGSKIRMYYYQRRYVDAKSTINELLKFEPESVHATYWQASIDDEEGRDAEALSGYLKALKNWDNEFFPNMDVGQVLVDLNRPDESITYFNKAIEIRPYSAEAFSGRSRAQLSKKDWSAALADAETSIALDPAQSIGYARRAGAEAELGLIDMAKADYATSIQNNSKLEWIHQDNLAFLIKYNLLVDAKSALQKARLRFPNATFIAEEEAILRQRGVSFP